NPGAQRIPEAPRRVRGWVVAASLDRTCYLTLEGQLWFRGAVDHAGWQKGLPARLDPTGRHRVLLLPHASAPFADAWNAARADGRRLSTYGSLNLDEAIAETFGELCLAHGLSWPEQDADA